MNPAQDGLAPPGGAPSYQQPLYLQEPHTPVTSHGYVYNNFCFKVLYAYIKVYSIRLNSQASAADLCPSKVRQLPSFTLLLASSDSKIELCSYLQLQHLQRDNDLM